MRPRVHLVYFDAGGGHRSSATALKTVIEREGRDWDVSLVQLQEVLDPLDVFRKLTGRRLQDLYNLILRKGWTLGSPLMAKGLRAVIRHYHREQVEMLERFWRGQTPDLAVSLVPNFNRVLFEGLKAASPRTPFVTVLTDMADCQPHLWIERQEQFFICGTERACQQALEAGHAAERVFRTSGMILRPQFYEPIRVDPEVERRRLALSPTTPTGLVLFGGYGAGVMLKIAQRLQGLEGALQLITICGRNDGLAEKLRNLRSRIPMHVEGFTTEVPYYMHLADFFVGKPGPGSISEALAMKLPVIVERNAWTLPQERYNADWIREKQVGVVVTSFRQVAAAVKHLLEGDNLARYRANTAALGNRAVFEIPELLERILRAGSRRRAGAESGKGDQARGCSGQACLG